MSKRILSLMLCFVMVLTTIMVVPVGAVTYLQTKISVVPDKTTAAPGDVINYTVVMGPVSDLGSLQMELVIPEGLTYKPGTGKITDGLMEAMGFDALDWTEESLIINGGASAADYNSDRSTILGTFSCTVDEGFYGTAAVDLTYLEFYSCQTWDDHTERFSVVTTPITVEPPAQVFATEVYYAGAKLDATNKYLYYKVDAGVVTTSSSASDVPEAGYSRLAEFEPATGKLTMQTGFNINYWNSYSRAQKIDNVYYGIRANGSLTIDIGEYNNNLSIDWNYPDNGSTMENICVDGNLTITGTTGVLRVAAIPTMNTEGSFMSYGIKATGDVYLNGGTVEFYTVPVYLKEVKAGSKVTQLASLEGNIYFGGSTVQFLGEPGKNFIIKMNKEPQFAGGYMQQDVSNVIPSGSTGSIGCYTTDGSNNSNAAKYVPAVTISFVTNGGTPVEQVISSAGENIDLSLYETTREGYRFVGWYKDEELTQRATTFKASVDVTVYAKWKEASLGGGATEVYYAGAKLDATNKYLLYKIENGAITTKTGSSPASPDGYLLLGEFDPVLSRLTMKTGFNIDGWNSYSEAQKMDGVYYGIYANGDLTIDIGEYKNTLNLNWNYPDNGDVMENICVEGNLTIRGTTGILRIASTPTMNTDGNFMSYGIKATGDVYLKGGTIEFYTAPVYLKTVKAGSKVTQLASVDGDIIMDGATVQFLGFEDATYITKMNKTPIISEGYEQPDVSNLVLNGSIGWYKTDGSGNANAAKYVAPPKKIVTIGGAQLSKDAPYLVKDGNGWAVSEFADGAVASFDAINNVLELKTSETFYGVSCSIEDGGLEAYTGLGASFPLEIKLYNNIVVNLYATSKDGVARALWSNSDLKISGSGTLNIAAGPSIINGNYLSGGIWTDGKLTIDGVNVIARTVFDQKDGKSGYAIYGAGGVDIVNGASVIAGTDKGKLINVAPTLYTGTDAVMSEASTGDMDTPIPLGDIVPFDAATVTSMKYLKINPLRMDLLAYAGYGVNGTVVASNPIIEFVFATDITTEVTPANINVSDTATVERTEKDGNILWVTLGNVTKGSTYNVSLNNIGGYNGTVSVVASKTDVSSVKLNGELGLAQTGTSNTVEVAIDAVGSQKVFVSAVVWDDAETQTAKFVKSVETTVSGTDTVVVNGIEATSGDVIEVFIWDDAISRNTLDKPVAFGN